MEIRGQDEAVRPSDLLISLRAVLAHYSDQHGGFGLHRLLAVGEMFPWFISIWVRCACTCDGEIPEILSIRTDHTMRSREVSGTLRKKCHITLQQFNNM